MFTTDFAGLDAGTTFFIDEADQVLKNCLFKIGEQNEILGLVKLR